MLPHPQVSRSFTVHKNLMAPGFFGGKDRLLAESHEVLISGFDEQNSCPRTACSGGKRLNMGTLDVRDAQPISHVVQERHIHVIIYPFQLLLTQSSHNSRSSTQFPKNQAKQGKVPHPYQRQYDLEEDSVEGCLPRNLLWFWIFPPPLLMSIFKAALEDASSYGFKFIASS